MGRFGPGGNVGLFSASSLNTRLLVGRDHEIIRAQWRAFPNTLVEVEDGAGVGRKIGITRENPASMLPWTESIGAEPTPQGSAANFRDDALGNDVLPDLLNGEA
jgi:hypothetical protein